MDVVVFFVHALMVGIVVVVVVLLLVMVEGDDDNGERNASTFGRARRMAKKDPTIL